MQIAVKKIKKESSDVSSFIFSKPEGFDYIAGQYVELTLKHQNPDERGIKRWFTLSSSPSEKYLAITTRRSSAPSSFKKHLFSLKLGDKLVISPQMGDFVLPKNKNKKLFFVAIGIGITPFRSMLKFSHDRKLALNVKLIHSDTKNQFVFGDELSDYIDEIEHTSKKLGFKSIDSSAIYYLAGPEHAIEKLVKTLKILGVVDSSIRTDFFHNYD